MLSMCSYHMYDLFVLLPYVLVFSSACLCNIISQTISDVNLLFCLVRSVHCHLQGCRVTYFFNTRWSRTNSTIKHFFKHSLQHYYSLFTPHTEKKNSIYFLSFYNTSTRTLTLEYFICTPLSLQSFFTMWQVRLLTKQYSIV